MIIDSLKSTELYAKIYKFIKVFEIKQLNELLTIILILAKICIQNLILWNFLFIESKNKLITVDKDSIDYFHSNSSYESKLLQMNWKSSCK